MVIEMTDNVVSSTPSGDWLRTLLLTLAFCAALGFIFAAFASIEPDAPSPLAPPAKTVVVIGRGLLADAQPAAGTFRSRLLNGLTSHSSVEVLEGTAVDATPTSPVSYFLRANVDLGSSYIGANWSLIDAQSGRTVRSGHVSAPARFGANGLADAVAEEIVGTQGAISALQARL